MQATRRHLAGWFSTLAGLPRASLEEAALPVEPAQSCRVQRQASNSGSQSIRRQSGSDAVVFQPCKQLIHPLLKTVGTCGRRQSGVRNDVHAAGTFDCPMDEISDRRSAAALSGRYSSDQCREERHGSASAIFAPNRHPCDGDVKYGARKIRRGTRLAWRRYRSPAAVRVEARCEPAGCGTTH